MALSSPKTLTCTTDTSARSTYVAAQAPGARSARAGRFSVAEAPASYVDPCRRASRHQHNRASSSRRAKSHSPIRHAPKLEHTHGRLDARPTATLDPELATSDTEAEADADLDLDFELLRRLSQTEKAELLSLREDVHRAVSSPASVPAHRFKIFYRDEALHHTCEQNTRRIIAAALRAEQSDNQGDAHGLYHHEGKSKDGDAASETVVKTEFHASDQHQQLALKALKYRKLLSHARKIDEKMLHDPSFDVLEFLGAKWCKM